MKTKNTEALGRKTELNQARSKPNTVDQPVRTAHTFLHHYNSTQYCNTETSFFSIFPFLQTNITSQMWPSGGKMWPSGGNGLTWTKSNVICYYKQIPFKSYTIIKNYSAGLTEQRSSLPSCVCMLLTCKHWRVISRPIWWLHSS